MLSVEEMERGHRCILEGYEWLFAERTEKHKLEISEKLVRCPGCNQVSLFYTVSLLMYECLNLRCKKKYAVEELNKLAVEEETRIQGIGEGYGDSKQGKRSS